MYPVTVNNTERKKEYDRQDLEFSSLLAVINEHFDIQGEITGVAYNGETKYDIYMTGYPTVSPIPLTHIELDPKINNLISFKLDLADKSIRVKVYYAGNVKNVDFHKPIAGTGIYVGEEEFTVYSPVSGDAPVDNILGELKTAGGFTGTTIYPDGSMSDESVYLYT